LGLGDLLLILRVVPAGQGGEETKNVELDRLGTVKTVNILTLAILIAYLIFGAVWLVWVAALLALGNALESRVTSALARGWLKFAERLGAFNSRVILTLTFYLILTPLAFLYRIFNRHLVEHFLANKRKSYFEDLNKKYAPGDFEKSW